MIVALHTLLFIVLCYAGFRFIPVLPVPVNNTRKVFCFAVIAKLGFTLLTFYIHTTVYTSTDLVAYWQDAEALGSLAGQNLARYAQVVLEGDCAGDCPELVLAYQPRAFLFARFLSLLYIFTGGSAWLASIWLSVISFAGAWYLFIALTRYMPKLAWPAAIALFFYPSPVFWSSGIQKEAIALPVIFAGTALMLPFMSNHKQAKAALRITGLLILAYVLWKVKYYYAIVFVPVLVSTTVVSVLAERWRFTRGKPGRQVAIWGLFLIGGLLIGRNFHIAFSTEHFLPLLVRTHNQVAGWSAAGTFAYMEDLRPDLSSFILHTPQALFTGLFRPLPGDGRVTLLNWLVNIENAVLLLLMVIGLYRAFKFRLYFLSLTGVATMVYCATLAVFLAFAMPNFGSLMRYKTAFLPFLLLLALIPFFKSAKSTDIK